MYKHTFMETTVQKWGNSLAIRIPKNITRDAKVEEGSSINIKFENGNIILTPSKKEHSLAELIKNITDENIHSELSTGSPVGGEIW